MTDPDGGEVRLTDREDREEMGQKLAQKGLVFQYGLEDGSPDPELAVQWFERAVKLGYIPAMDSLGMICRLREDDETAYQWFLEAALGGEADSLYHLGEMYFSGNYLNRDYEKAYRFFADAYRKGVKDAAFYMGWFAEKGLLAERDMDKAVAYYREGVSLGCAKCAAGLGRCCRNGTGVPADAVKGQEYSRLAHRWGYREACEDPEQDGETDN